MREREGEGEVLTVFPVTLLHVHAFNRRRDSVLSKIGQFGAAPSEGKFSPFPSIDPRFPRYNTVIDEQGGENRASISLCAVSKVNIH